MPAYTEADVSAVIDEVLDGVGLREAARKYNIPRQTMADRILGRKTNSEAKESKQRLSPDLEKKLVGFILKQESIGSALTHAQIRSLAGKILKNGGDSMPIGRHWLDGLFRRNAEIKTKRATRIDYKRVNGASPENINLFFLRLAEFSWIKPCNIFNADETGIMEGMGVNGLVVGSTKSNPKGTYVKGNQDRTWTSIVECISATGQALTPLVIFKAKSIQAQWFARDFNQPWEFTNSVNGWTSNDIALEWLEKVFIPETAPSDPSEARLLIVDGHGSHTTDDFMFDCFQQNIFLVFLPPHSSHVLQPLDVGVFSALKRAYRKHLSDLAVLTDSTPVGKLNFLRCYAKARKEGLTAQNIKAGYRGTGIYPRNKVKALGSRQVMAPPRSATPEPIAAAPFEFRTPKGRRGAQKLLDNTSMKTPSTRLAFRKLTKALEMMDAELAMAQNNIKGLELQNEKFQASKRRKKVPKDPNERFVTINQVIAARESMGVAADAQEGVESLDEDGNEGDATQAPPPRRSGRIRVPSKRAAEVDVYCEDS